jgi:hypothetical protein
MIAQAYPEGRELASYGRVAEDVSRSSTRT